jgi:hypothetical protein
MSPPKMPARDYYKDTHNLPAGIYGFSGGNENTQIFASFATNGNIPRVKILP